MELGGNVTVNTNYTNVHPRAWRLTVTLVTHTISPVTVTKQTQPSPN